MKSILVLASALTIMATTSCSRKTTYPDEWQWVDGAQFNKIAATLGKNQIRGCGEFWYKLENGEDRGAAAVACLSRDPYKWRYLTVFYNTMKVNEGWDGDPRPMPEIPR